MIDVADARRNTGIVWGCVLLFIFFKYIWFGSKKLTPEEDQKRREEHEKYYLLSQHETNRGDIHAQVCLIHGSSRSRQSPDCGGLRWKSIAVNVKRAERR